jgi:hypothetical protein
VEKYVNIIRFSSVIKSKCMYRNPIWERGVTLFAALSDTEHVDHQMTQRTCPGALTH